MANCLIIKADYSNLWFTDSIESSPAESAAGLRGNFCRVPLDWRSRLHVATPGVAVNAGLV